MPIELNDTGLEAAFTFESDRSGLVEEPPFHILALGDWSGSGPRSALPDRKLIEIDRDNFDEVMEKLGTSADLEFSDGSSLSLEFRSIDDFHPDEIFRRVDMFEQLRTLRKKLNDQNSFNSAAYEARQLFGIKRAQAAESSEPEEAADNLLDAILTKPEGGAAAPKRKVSGELGALVGELVRPYLVHVDEDEQSALISAVDAATGALMRSILHNPAFQELESAWRGLYFLVRRSDTNSELKIFILDATKNEIAEDLKASESLDSTKLARVLLGGAAAAGEPWSVVCGNYSFSPSVEDVAALMRISQISAAAKAPFIGNMTPDIFGVTTLHDAPDQSAWKVTDSDSTKLWTALRAQPHSAFLGMTTPRFLSRLPYTPDADPPETFNFDEFEEGNDHAGYAWSNGCFLATMLLGKTFSEHGWQMGQQLQQDVEGLPVHIYEDGGETIYKPCAEIVMTDVGMNKLMENGFMPLVSYKSTDRVKLARFQSISSPVTALKSRWTA